MKPWLAAFSRMPVSGASDSVPDGAIDQVSHGLRLLTSPKGA